MDQYNTTIAYYGPICYNERKKGGDARMQTSNEEYITVAEARQRLGDISKTTMANLIHKGKITVIPNGLDARSKLVKVSDLAAFVAQGAVARKRKTTKKEAPLVTARRRKATSSGVSLSTADTALL